MPPLRLEVFEVANAQEPATVVTDLNAIEEARLASYEQGYTAGWEDCVTAQADEKSQMSADLAHNLQSLNFTYHEARVHILKAIEPLLVDVVAHLLPSVAKSALAPTILKALLPFAENAAATPINIMFNPAARDAIEPLVGQEKGPPLVLVEETTLGEGQVFLQLGASEVRVDLDSAIVEIKAAIDDFFNLTTKELKNG
jgi:flagellar biosynthesis/type III secretory pathway protein FliH